MSPQRPGFARAVATLSTGTLLASLVTAGASVLLARLFGPADIGALGLYLAFLNVALVSASLRYETAIPAAADDREAGQLLLVSAALLPLTALAGGAVLLLLITLGVGGYGSLPAWSVLVAAMAIPMGGLFLAIRFWLLRSHEIAVVARASVSQALARAIAQIAAGFLRLGLGGLLLGDLVGRLGGVGPGLRSFLAWRAGDGAAGLRSLLPVVRRYRRFPLVVLPGSLVNALALVLPLPLIVHFYGLAVGGQFALLQRVVALPMSVVGSSVADVFHVHLGEARRRGITDAQRDFDQLAIRLTALAVPGAIVLFLAGPLAFRVVFGDVWEEAGLMAAMTAPLVAAQFVVSSLSRVTVVYGGERAKLVYDVSSLAAVIVSLSAAHAFGASPTTAVAWYSLSQCAAYGVHFLVLRRLVRGARPAPDEAPLEI